MSNLLGNASGDARCVVEPAEAIELVIDPRIKDLGSFSVRRLLPSPRRTLVGPFIFFDHFGPTRFQVGEGMDVRPHPHINLATVTYLFEGEVLHRDSLGNVQTIRPGEINWMTAGRGIVHSERSPEEVRAAEHPLHGLQLWVALPRSHEETDPSFQHWEADALPSLEERGLSIRVLVGEAFGLRSPVTTLSEAVYLDVRLSPGAAMPLPEDFEERAVYVVSGSLQLGETDIGAQTMTVFSPGPGLTLTAAAETRLVLIGGAPLGKRHVWWNYVSSRKSRIEQAKSDWKNRRFTPVPGETEFIPLPEG